LHVDTVQELTQILVGDLSGLVDKGAGLRNVIEVCANNGDDVLLLLLLGDGDARKSVHSLVHLDSDEILDFKGLL
jgi:hypothetical protein